MHRIYLLLARHPRLPLLSLALLLALSLPLGLRPATSPGALPAPSDLHSPQSGANPCTLAPLGAAAHRAAWLALLDLQSRLDSHAGKVAPCAVETSTYSQPAAIAAGPDGNLWFTEQQRGAIGRITPQGTIAEYPLPPGHSAFKIAAGRDGNLWFTDLFMGSIGRISTEGRISFFTLPRNSGPFGIAGGPDGNIWFTEMGHGAIGQLTTSGELKEFRL